MRAVAFFLLAVPLWFSCNQPKKKPEPKEFVEKIVELVLSENKVGQEYFFKIMLSKGVEEYKVTYIGKVSTVPNDTLRFVYYTWFGGHSEDSKHAASRVVLYDRNYNRLGLYYVGGGFDSIPRIKGSDLVFVHNEDDCDQTTAISFKYSIPPEIFIHCRQDSNGHYWGDIYSFSKPE